MINSLQTVLIITAISLILYLLYGIIISKFKTYVFKLLKN